MRMTAVDIIKIILPKTDSAKEFMRLVGECSQIADKSLVGIYLSHFLYFWGLNFVFLSFRDTFFSIMGRRKVKKNIMTNMPIC